MGEQTSIKNQEANYSPNGSQVTGTVDAVKTFKQLGVDPDNRIGMLVIEIDTDGDLYYRCDGEDPTSADSVLEAGTYLVGKQEARFSKFLNVGANVTVIMQPHNFDLIK